MVWHFKIGFASAGKTCNGHDLEGGGGRGRGGGGIGGGVGGIGIGLGLLLFLVHWPLRHLSLWGQSELIKHL